MAVNLVHGRYIFRDSRWATNPAMGTMEVETPAVTTTMVKRLLVIVLQTRTPATRA